MIGASATEAAPTAIVVGGGISGLTAAYRLQQAGWQVSVLEASDRISGRAHTLRKDGYTIDTGASAMTNAYGAYLSLAKELGIMDQVVDAKSVVGIHRDGKLHEFDTSHVVSTGLRTGLFSFRAKLRMLKLLRDVDRARRRGQLNYDDMTKAAELDDESARDYTLRELGEEIQDYLCDPLTRVMLIADSDRVTKVELFSAISNIFGTRMLALLGGVGAFADALAKSLEIRFNAEVTKVDDTSDRVEVHWRDSDRKSHIDVADTCVVTCPLPDALAICPNHQDSLGILDDALEYTACLNVAVGMSTRPNANAFAIPLPVPVSKEFALLFLDHNKAPDRTPEGRYMISAHWENVASQQMLGEPDEVIADKTVRFLTDLFPEIEDSVEMTHVARWPRALPLTLPGAYKAFRQFSENVDPTSNVQFAGDYLSATGQNTAVVFGERAANNLITRNRNAS